MIQGRIQVARFDKSVDRCVGVAYTEGKVEQGG